MKFNTPNGQRLLELRIQVHIRSKIYKKLNIHCASLYLFPARLYYRPGPFSVLIVQLLLSIFRLTFQTSYQVDGCPPEFSDIYQAFEYLGSTGLLHINQSFIGVLYVCLTSIVTSLDYFMFTGFPYIYQNFIGLLYVYLISLHLSSYWSTLSFYQISLHLSSYFP